MLQLGFIGCGGISRAHFDGLVELRRAGRQRFELRAVCDLDQTLAENLADRAEAELGKRPRVFGDYRSLLEKGGVDAVTVMVHHHLHHIMARDAFAAGVHVQMQKPIAISPRFAQQMLSDARATSKVITVSEPAILGAGPRALAAAIHDGLIGQLYLVIDFATAATKGGFFGGTPWRHMKGYAGAGWINDHGVHRTAQFVDVGGAIDEVFAYSELFEPIRRDTRGELKTTGEDAAVTVFRFASGALGHWMCATAIHGEGAGGVWFYGSKGVLRPHQYAKFDDGSTISWEEIINRYAPNVIRGDFAHSYLELADAIEHGAPPISSANLATEALCVVFAALESATIGQPVKVADVMAGNVHAYEDTVVDEMAALSKRS